MPTARSDRAGAFRRLHDRAAGRVLVLPNVWDAMSARVVEEAGAPALATTSSGVSWALGRPDGQGLTRDEMVGVVRRIAAAVRVPVSADMEKGYGAGTPADVAETARQVLDAGAVGLNLEDGADRAARRLTDVARQAECLAAARAASPDLFVNARVDVYLYQWGDEEARFDETVRRAAAYVAAGADGIFVPGVADAATIGRLAAAIDAPLNVLAGPGAPSVGALRALGVARVSVGASLARSVLGHVRRAAAEVLGAGTYDAMRDGVPFAEADALFPRAR